ncbi:MAG TPA: CapA family protein [Xanthobacteraceae bacterium]|nr:CapA family protein [Xanthobacteraceae bacterium]
MTASETPPAALRLAFVGDLMLGRKVTAQLRAGKPPAAFWGDVRPQCLACDAVIGNLEAPITGSKRRWRGIKSFRFCADPRAVDILRAGNVKCVSLANNHILDCAGEGLIDTRRHLAAAGIAHAGAGADLTEAMAPAIFRANGLDIGFVSITNTMWPFAAGAAKPGTRFLLIRRDRATLALLGGQAAELRRCGAAVVILSVHWGPNLRPWPPRRYRRFAHAMIEAGYDIVHGHSAHLLQAVEFHRHGLILYDTGDFIEDFWVFPGIRTDRSCLFVLEYSGAQPPLLKLLPLCLTPGEVNLAAGREAAAIRNTMLRRCRGYAVNLERDGEGLVATAPPPR